MHVLRMYQQNECSMMKDRIPTERTQNVLRSSNSRVGTKSIAEFVRSVRRLTQLVISRLSAKETATSRELVQETLGDLEERSTVLTSSTW